MSQLFIIWIQVILALTHLCIYTARAKAKAKGSPDPWDWQRAPSLYPVFDPFPTIKKTTEQPEFLAVNSNVSVIVGETAHLPCRVKNLIQHYTVSWIRASDVTVLSVGHLAFSSDQRISVLEIPRPRLSASDWSLNILNTSTVDQGVYECQVNTDPKINRKVFLTVHAASGAQGDSPYYDVVEPAPVSGYERTHSTLKKHRNLSREDEGFTMWLHDNGCICPRPESKTHNAKPKRKGAEMTISGGDVQYVSQGSGVGLECRVSGLAKPPVTLHWERGNKVVTAKGRPGLSLETEKLAGVSSVNMYVAHSQISDTGNYTCVSDKQSQTTLLVVTQGQDHHPKGLKEATFSSSSSTTGSQQLLLILALSVVARKLSY